MHVPGSRTTYVYQVINTSHICNTRPINIPTKMAASTPVIQVLSRQNYEEQHIVSLPNALPLPSLAPNSIRVTSSILALSTNNLTYARLGHLLGWWNFYPLPSSIPSEFSDPAAYGRISAWGFGTVVESTTAIKPGTEVYGYLPIGTLPVDMRVEIDSEVPGMFVETSHHRAKLMAVYNRYFLEAPAVTTQEKEVQKQSQGYDAIGRVLHETAYMMNRFAFGWHPEEIAHPAGASGGEWSIEKANLAGATVLIFSASGKTAISFAYQLKHGRPEDAKPEMVIAVGSKHSKTFTENTDLFGRVLDYGYDTLSGIALGQYLGLRTESKVVIFDFGARGSAAMRWSTHLKQDYTNVHYIAVGGEVVPLSPQETIARFTAAAQSGMVDARVNASDLRDSGIKAIGRKAFFEGAAKDWKQYKAKGMAKGSTLIWGEGMEDLGKGWDKLCKGEVAAGEGLVFSLVSNKPHYPKL